MSVACDSLRRVAALTVGSILVYYVRRGKVLPGNLLTVLTVGYKVTEFR